MTAIIRDYEEGQMIPDANTEESYTYEELDGARLLDYIDDPINGHETYELIDGRIATIQSIDLDWVAPHEESLLRTTSYNPAH